MKKKLRGQRAHANIKLKADCALCRLRIFGLAVIVVLIVAVVFTWMNACAYPDTFAKSLGLKTCPAPAPAVKKAPASEADKLNRAYRLHHAL